MLREICRKYPLRPVLDEACVRKMFGFGVDGHKKRQL